jgi:hypothetical protein
MIRKIEVERFSLITSKEFDDVAATINGGIGHPVYGQVKRVPSMVFVSKRRNRQFSLIDMLEPLKVHVSAYAEITYDQIQ